MDGLHLVSRNAIRVLLEEARLHAALQEFPSEEHDFYFGVMTAARDHLHPANCSVHDDSWIGRQTASFRDGYMKTSLLIAAAGTDGPHHLPLPKPD